MEALCGPFTLSDGIYKVKEGCAINIMIGIMHFICIFDDIVTFIVKECDTISTNSRISLTHFELFLFIKKTDPERYENLKHKLSAICHIGKKLKTFSFKKCIANLIIQELFSSRKLDTVEQLTEILVNVLQDDIEIVLINRREIRNSNFSSLHRSMFNENIVLLIELKNMLSIAAKSKPLTKVKLEKEIALTILSNLIK